MEETNSIRAAACIRKSGTAEKRGRSQLDSIFSSLRNLKIKQHGVVSFKIGYFFIVPVKSSLLIVKPVITVSPEVNRRTSNDFSITKTGRPHFGFDTGQLSHLCQGVEREAVVVLGGVAAATVVARFFPAKTPSTMMDCKLLKTHSLLVRSNVTTKLLGLVFGIYEYVSFGA